MTVKTFFDVADAPIFSKCLERDLTQSQVNAAHTVYVYGQLS